ncbi:TerD family protein [Streptomyces sp. NPDC050738]|uniref:TerD family protein n=1 Tax=Streptomyces sp. NPDC050738 TaxID=3154744 RepID=UPI00341F7A15
MSTRGVRTSVGPRAARVSFGSGGTRLSTGAGPFYASTSLGGRSSSRSRRPASPSGAPVRVQQQAERDRAVAELQRIRRETTTVHLQDFAPCRPPQIPPPPHHDLDWARRAAEAHHLDGIGILSRTDRSTARAQAAVDAPAYLAAEQARLAAVHARIESEARQWWTLLTVNNEETVCGAVNEAFADNPASGCAVGVSGSVLSVVVRQPDLDSLPTRTPALTPAGRPTVKNITRRDRTQWWMTSMGSHVVATLREAFAVAPGITAVDLAVLTRIPDTRRLGIVAYGRWTRQAVESAHWRTAEDALRFLDLGTGVECAVTTTVKALDVSRIPGLAGLLGDVREETLGDLESGLSAPPRTAPATRPYVPLPFADWKSGATAVVLRPGQNVPLPPAAEELLGLRASSVTGIDLSVLLLDGRERVARDADFVFYNQPTGAHGAVRLTGDDRAELHLGRLPDSVRRLALTVSADTPPGVRLTLSSPSGGSWRFEVPPADGITALVLVELYRHGPHGWKLRAVGQGWSDGLAGLARDYGVDVN